MAELTAQMNVRMSRSLKEAGDAALASVGLTPTEVVRAIWEKASRRGKDLESVVRLLAPSSARAHEADAENPVLRGSRIVAEGMRELGIRHLGTPELSYEELREQAFMDRLEERGLL